MSRRCAPLTADPPISMSNLFSKILRAMLGLFAAVPVISAAEPSPVPKDFSATIGGFLGMSYHLELHGGVLTYTTFDGGPRNTKRANVTPTEMQWREFRQTLDRLKVWKWRAKYEDVRVRDGTQWSLEITCEDRAIKSHGNNSYPESRNGPDGMRYRSKAFQSYLDAVQKLIGGKTFQ